MRVGLTGGIASGKSTVAQILVELGAVLIDGDALAREVVARGTPGLAQVVEEFGEDLLTPEGDLDRAALGRIVFSDEAARRRLEAITHPLIFERYAELEAAAPPGAVVVHDIPLLAESGRADTFDAVIVVDVPAELQVERMMRDRGWTREEAESRIAAQASREDRLAIATYVIENTGSLDDLRPGRGRLRRADGLVNLEEVRDALTRCSPTSAPSRIEVRRRGRAAEYLLPDGSLHSTRLEPTASRSCWCHRPLAAERRQLLAPEPGATRYRHARATRTRWTQVVDEAPGGSARPPATARPGSASCADADPSLLMSSNDGSA